MSEYLFKIDFNQWKLLKDAETGELKDPVAPENFDRYEYWDDKGHRPVRQIITKNGRDHYADYLNIETGKLERRVASVLGWSPYDDEISKEAYEELCQTALLEHHYHRNINDRILVPYQRLALSYYQSGKLLFIKHVRLLYPVNIEKKQLEKRRWFKEKILSRATQLSEYEFYYAVIRELQNIHGSLLPDQKPH